MNDRTEEDCEAYDRFEDDVGTAMCYVRNAWEKGAYTRDGSLDDWWAIKGLTFEELVAKGQALKDQWAAMLHVDDDIEDEEDDWEDYSTDRTIPYHPQMDDWIYVRFGHFPRKGGSVFGLSTGPTEDSIDEWAVATGNKRSESGICVFRAYRHPDVEGAYIIMEPNTDKALYNARFDAPYLRGISGCETPDELAEKEVYVIEGSVCTVKDAARRLHVDLGSDGEFLIDPAKPKSVELIGSDMVYVSRDKSVAEFMFEHYTPSYGI